MLRDQIDLLDYQRKAANLADRKNCTQSLIKGLTEGYYVVSEYSHILSEDGGSEIRVGIIELQRSCARNQANKKNPFSIDKIIFNPPATIIFWSDGTKTVVKCGEHEEFDPEKGLAMAGTKKAFGNEGNDYNKIKKWLPEKEEPVFLGEMTGCDVLAEAFKKFGQVLRTALGDDETNNGAD